MVADVSVRSAGGRAAETHARLIRAAMEVMAEKGLDAPTIDDITARAGVGKGSLYNHFGDRDGLQKAVMQVMLTDYANAVDVLHNHFDNPLVVMTGAARITYTRAMNDKAWGWFFLRSSEKGGLISRGLGKRLRRDLDIAQKAKLITLHNIDHMALAVSGTVMAFLSAGLHGDLKKSDAGTLAETILIMLGLGRNEARKIASQPLPKMEF